MRSTLPVILIIIIIITIKSYRWLNSGDFKGETESTIVAVQEQAISTNYFKNKISKEETESKCRLCSNMKNYLPLNLGMPHFGEERIFNET